MATLYLLEQGTSVYKDYRRFIIHVPEKNKLEVPIKEVERILVFGNVQLSTPVINVCLQTPISILFLSPSGQYKGHLWSMDAINFDLELSQFEKKTNSPYQLKVCRSIVRGKLINSRQLLMRLNRKHKLASVKRAIDGIDSDLQRVEVVDNLDTLRGYEGASAARYFPALGQLITNAEFSFAQRHRQPPTDPINSLLSFGYTILFNNVLSLILVEGLSPYFGNFHYGERKKPYLAFDLMEEFRSPIVDSLVLKMINKPLFKSNDFEVLAQNQGVYLTDEARRTFLSHLESRMNEKVSHPDLQSPVSYRHAIQLQIRRYRRSLLSSTLYEPFLRST